VYHYGNFGQWSLDIESHFVPFHQIEQSFNLVAQIPLEAMSARLSSDFT